MNDCYITCILALILLWLMFKLSTRIEGFMKGSDPVLNELKKQLQVLHPEFRTLEVYEGDKSYTINKKKVYICLKDKNGRYYNRNMLVYVMCHEFAHVLAKTEEGHTEKFNQIFADLLEQATQAGLYNPSIPPLTNYCGHS